MTGVLAVTGSTGALGQLVARALPERGQAPTGPASYLTEREGS